MGIPSAKAAGTDTTSAGEVFKHGMTDTQSIIKGLQDHTNQVGANAAEKAKDPKTQAEAQQLLNNQQFMVKFTEQLLGLFLSVQLLPTKIFAALARGLGLTAL
ncbi:MAG: hypothetical protein HOA17_10080 [Candidatus Melainabacteria bacterium]|jgi:hypothetical protein|nr:hypothetical protein [Candidatus Melainabacteria bacterium]